MGKVSLYRNVPQVGFGDRLESQNLREDGKREIATPPEMHRRLAMTIHYPI